MGKKGTSRSNGTSRYHVSICPLPHPEQRQDRGSLEGWTLWQWCATFFAWRDGALEIVKTERGATSESLWRSVASFGKRKRRTWVWFCDGTTNATLSGLWKEFLTGRFVLTPDHGDAWQPATSEEGKPFRGFLALDGKPFLCRCMDAGSGKIVEIGDLQNWVAEDLPDLCSKFGVSLPRTPEFARDREVWANYAVACCVAIGQIVEAILRTLTACKLGQLAYTPASQTFRGYRKHTTVREYWPTGDDAVKCRDRQAYFGGLAQQWFQGKIIPFAAAISPKKKAELSDGWPVQVGPMYVLDASSFYPSIIAKHLLPTCRLPSIGTRNQDACRAVARTGAAVAEVQISCNGDGYPVRRNGKTFYAVGRFTTSLCGPELIRAVDQGHVVKFVSIQPFTLGPVAQRYIAILNERQKQAMENGDGGVVRVLKILKNALYGKFAQRSLKWAEVRDARSIEPFAAWSDVDAKTGEVTTHRAVLHQVYRQTSPVHGVRSWPILSAFVTAIGREVVREWRHTAGETESFYSDTDSIFTTERGFLRLEKAGWTDGRKFCCLKVKKVANAAWLVAPKVYFLDDSLTAAGIKKTAERVENSGWMQLERLGLFGLLHLGRTDSVSFQERKIQIDTTGGRQIVTTSGWIQPPRLDEF